MYTIEIEDNVAIPYSHGSAIYPYDALAVGQSFFVPFNPETHKSPLTLRNSLLSGIHRRKKQGKSYTLRSLPGGVRVWRIA